MKFLSKFLLVFLLAIPASRLYAQTPTSTPTPTADYRTFVTVGMIQLLAGSPPDTATGWLVCDGSAVSRTTYALLFSTIGTTYGAGDGSTTFNLPDMRGRVPVGAGAGSGLTPRTVGQTMGEETHLLTTAEMPQHSHGLTDSQGNVIRLENGASNQTFGIRRVAGVFNLTLVAPLTTQNTGGNTPHNIMQPGLVVNYVIWAGTVEMETAGQVIITVVVNFPTHTPTPTATPTLTPTAGPSPTPTETPTPTGLAPYEEVVSIAGQDVLVRNEVQPFDLLQTALLMTFLVLGIGGFSFYLRRRRR